SGSRTAYRSPRLPPFCGVKTKPPQNLEFENRVSDRTVKVIDRPRRAAASPSQHTGDEPGVVLRSQMMLFPDRLAILVGHHHRIIDDNVKALGNATRIRAPWCSGLYDNPFHFVGHAIDNRGYSN